MRDKSQIRVVYMSSAVAGSSESDKRGRRIVRLSKESSWPGRKQRLGLGTLMKLCFAEVSFEGGRARDEERRGIR